MATDRKTPALDRVRGLAIAFAHVRQERDQAIVQAREAGCTLRQLASASHLSKDAVRDILDRA